MILGEKLEREENLEKKRKFAKEREKSPKKENFFQRKFSFHFFVNFLAVSGGHTKIILYTFSDMTLLWNTSISAYTILLSLQIRY